MMQEPSGDIYSLPIEKKAKTFREILDDYLPYWPWFVICSLIALLVALLYLRFTPATYVGLTTIIIENEEGKPRTPENSNFVDLGLLKGLSTSSIENEMGLLRSKRLMANAVKALDLNVLYFAEDGIPQREIYKRSPYLVRLIRMDESKLKKEIENFGNELVIHHLGRDRIELEFEDDGAYIETRFGDIVELEFADFVVELSDSYDSLPNEEPFESVLVKFLPVESMASMYQSNLGVDVVDENSTLIQVSIIDRVKEKARDILDQLIFEYNQEAIEDKNLIARNTAFFIDERLKIINSELDSVETGKEEFKEANKLTNIEAESSIIIQNASEYNKKEQEVNTQLELNRAMISQLDANSSNLLPTNMGIDESGTTQLIDEYNQLILERDRLLNGATDQNPLVVNLNNQIQQIKNNVKASLERRRSNLVIARDNLRRQAGILGSQISDVPAQERQFRGIERQQNIKEALYLFLLQKREENSLALAVTAPKAKLVDRAYTFNDPISPNKKIVLAVALLAGLFLPFVYINGKSLLNNKIRHREDLDEMLMHTDISIIGEIPHHEESAEQILQTGVRSINAEAFNILTANLQYVLGNENVHKNGTCILVTSSVMGEGKTFTVMNLGVNLARSGHSILVLGADLRNPQLHEYNQTKKGYKGLANYLAGETENLPSLIRDSHLHPNLKIFYSGRIPPNPTELLRGPYLAGLFDELKSVFDFIIVDTPPAAVLADSLFINKYADLTLYLVRARYTKKKFLNFALDAKQQGRVEKMAIVLNDVKPTEAGYGYGYSFTDQNKDKDYIRKLRKYLKKLGAALFEAFSSLRRMKNLKLPFIGKERYSEK